jgi:hypothetical protein
MMIAAQSSDLRPAGASGRMAAAAYAAKPSRQRRASGTTAADAARVTPEACLRHDASEGHEGETFMHWV